MGTRVYFLGDKEFMEMYLSSPMGIGVYFLGDKEFKEMYLSSPICLNGKYGVDFLFIYSVIITRVHKMFTTSAQLVQYIVQQHHHMRCKYNPRLSVFLIMHNLS
jgi:hypothetical protein